MYIKFLDSKTPIECVVKSITPNIVELIFADEIIVNTSGFRAYKDKKCEYDIGGNSYIGFTTMYRNDESTVSKNSYQLSNDGSTYEKPIYTVSFLPGNGGELDGITKQSVETYEELSVPIPIPNENYEFSEWTPNIPLSGDIKNNITFTAQFTYVPTLEDLKALKIKEMENIKQEIEEEGFNATLSNGETEHFTLSSKDQLFLTALQTQVIAGVDPIPWHVSDRNVACKNYSNVDMGIITSTALGIISFHETYIVDITRYINSIQSTEELSKVYYGMNIPKKYQSEPLKDMLALQNA